MADSTKVADFTFVANKSFLSRDHRLITIPARCYALLKESGLTETVRASIHFRDGPSQKGNIRIGWRAGHQYYQIGIAAAQANVTMQDVTLDQLLTVQIFRAERNWLVMID